MSGVGDRFQEETRYERGRLSGGRLDWANKPGSEKRYPDAPRVALDAPRLSGGASLWETLRDRQSVRQFGGNSLTRNEVSRLLWATQGITHSRGEFQFRTAPSAGGLYPVETYVAIHRVDELEPGIYHYSASDHALEQLKTGDFRIATARAALDQRMAYDADLVLIWSAVFARSKWKYKQRAYRYIYLDAGHIAQNAALAAVALGLGSCQIAALYDGEANELVGLDGEQESVIYMTAVGRPVEGGA